MEWDDANCSRCSKGPSPYLTGCNPKCDIETAITLAAATDGTLLHGGDCPMNKADAIAKRLNWDGRGYLCHKCPEFVP